MTGLAVSIAASIAALIAAETAVRAQMHAVGLADGYPAVDMVAMVVRSAVGLAD